MSRLIIEDLAVSYGEIRAVKNISFEVRAGEIFTLIGANGAGKTSTLRAISGMLKYSGRVVFDGRDLRGIPSEKMVELGMAHVPEGRGIFGNLTVLENLKLGAWVQKNKVQISADLERVLHIFPRLKERSAQAAGTLSGGEQQMLAVGRALMSRASLLLLDEPSMGLAPKLVQEIYRVLAEIHAEGTTILLVEQNANLALRLAARAGVLETGTLALQGDSSEIRDNPRIREAYLGV